MIIPVIEAEQLQTGTSEYASDRLVDHGLGLSRMDPPFADEARGTSAYDPRVMLVGKSTFHLARVYVGANAISLGSTIFGLLGK